jgi:Uma2 family endonuclease
MTTILREADAGRTTIVRWSIEQYHRAIELGLLPEDASLELLEGFVVRKDRAKAGEDPMTIGDRHRVAVLRLARTAPLFDAHACFLQTQQPISLHPLNEPEPDGAVIRGDIDDYLHHPPAAPDLFCVVEVADSSRTLDLGPKLRAYASAGIPQYVVVDLVNERVIVHDTPTGESYSRVTHLASGDTLQMSTGGGHVPLPVERLLP